MSSTAAAPQAGVHRPGAGLRRLAGNAFLVAALSLLLAPSAPAQAQAPTFEVQRFEVEGNTLLDPVQIDDALLARRGGALSFADLQAAVAALQLAYARAGFGAVRAFLPEQQVASGTVRITVIEPRLRKVTIDGPPDLDLDRIRRALPALREGATPNTDDLAREIALANENPARRISVDLRSEASGQIDATVAVVQDRPWRVGAVFDNTGTAGTGRTRIGVFFQHANVTQQDHVATLQYVTSPTQPDDVTIAALNYRVPLPALGDSLDLYGIYASVDAGVVSDLFSVRGRGRVLGLRYTQNLPPSATWRHRLLWGVEQRPIDNQVGLVGGSPDLAPDITLHPASLGYAGSWTEPGRQVELRVTGVHNLPRGSRGKGEAFAAARAGASASYAILRYGLRVQQALPGDWQVRVVVDGQYTRDALVSGEQFGIGGQDSVRGFDERELINDIGNRATLELQTPDFGGRIASGVFARALLFLDHGWLRRNQPLPGEVTHSHIASVGAGLRLSLAPSWNLRLDLSRVAQGTDAHPRGSDHIGFSLGYAY
ncbi:MAG: ShlB/FhaC/HecB family hemolysin secretion/activation protein [Caldimonas sp.]